MILKPTVVKTESIEEEEAPDFENIFQEETKGVEKGKVDDRWAKDRTSDQLFKYGSHEIDIAKEVNYRR